MPHHAEVRADCASGNKTVNNVNRLSRQHFLGAQAVGKITVIAVDITKRCGLQDEQLDSLIGRSPIGATSSTCGHSPTSSQTSVAA